MRAITFVEFFSRRRRFRVHIPRVVRSLLPGVTARFRGSAVARNATYNLLGWTVFLITNLVVLPYAVRHLGAEEYGVFVLITSVVGFLGLLELGLGDAVVKHVSAYQVRGEYERIGRLLSTAIGLLCVAGLAAGLTLFFAAPALGELLVRAGDSVLKADAVLGLRLASVGVVLTLAISPLGSVPAALQRYGIHSGVTASFATANASFTILVIALGYGLVGLVLMTIASTAVLGSVQLAVARRLLPRIRLHWRIDREEAFNLLSYGGFVVLNRLAYLTNTQVFRILVGVLLGGAAVTYFTVAQRVVLAGAGVFASLANVMLPAASALEAADDQRALGTLLRRSAAVIGGVAILPFGAVFLFARPIMTAWMGAEFAGHSWRLLAIMAVAQYLLVLGMPSNRIALGTGYARMATMVALAATVASLFSLIPLQALWGLEGVALAVAVGGGMGMLTHVLLARALSNHPGAGSG